MSGSSLTRQIPAIQIAKPSYGSPCNGCGTCCIEEVCALGLELGDKVNCMALVDFLDGSYGCGLILDPYRYITPDQLLRWAKMDDAAGYPVGEQTLKNYYVNALGAGQGCDSSDE